MADYKSVTEWGPNYKNILVGKLTEGKGFANKLKNLIQNPVQDDHSSVTDSAHQLVINMLASFSDAISVLTSCDDDSDGFSDQIPAVGSTCSGDRMSECSGQSRKRPDRRGCYKRRKTSDSTRIIVAPTSEDEYAWRKYGQKEILNAKQPRCYYRCTHKKDKGCKALKQVQKLEDGSNMYHITYFSHHTCKSLVKSAQMFQDQPLNSYLLSFETKRPNTSREDYQCSGPTRFVPLVKEEPNREQCEVLSDNLSSVDSNLRKEMIAIGSSNEEPAIMNGATRSCVHESSGSGSSYRDLDMDFLLKSVDFYSDFPFGEME